MVEMKDGYWFEVGFDEKGEVEIREVDDLEVIQFNLKGFFKKIFFWKKENRKNFVMDCKMFLLAFTF